LKIQNSGGRHLEKSQNCDISATVLPIFMKFGLLVQNRPLKSLNFTNPRWRTAAILKTVKSPYLCNRLTDIDEILHSDAHCPLTAD